MNETADLPVLRRLTRISVCGFKSLSSPQHVEIRPLTILAGTNSGGKSSLMQPLLLLKQTLDVPYDPGSLLLDGANVRFTSSDQFFSQTLTSGSAKTLVVGFQVGNVAIDVHIAQEKGVGAVVTKNVVVEGGQTLELAADASKEQLMEAAKRYAKTRLSGFKVTQCFLQRERFFFNLIAGLEINNRPRLDVPLVSTGESVGVLIAGVIHVPGLRGNPKREYPKSSVSETFPGTFEPYVASVVHSWQQMKDSRLKTLGQQLERLGLTWKVESAPLNETQVELKVGRLPHARQGGAKDLVSIADVGFGVSQVLPVLVALLVARPGQVVYLEQPEIHLHPSAQKALAEIISEASKRDVTVIVETHSSLLIQGVQTLVARDQLDNDIVKLHWFARDKGGETMVRSGDMDDVGAVGDWPADFDDVTLRANDEYLDAVDAKFFSKAAAN